MKIEISNIINIVSAALEPIYLNGEKGTQLTNDYKFLRG